MPNVFLKHLTRIYSTNHRSHPMRWSLGAMTILTIRMMELRPSQRLELAKDHQPIRGRVRIWYQESSNQLLCLPHGSSHRSPTIFTKPLSKCLLSWRVPPSAPEAGKGCKALVCLHHKSSYFARFLLLLLRYFHLCITVRSLCRVLCINCKMDIALRTYERCYNFRRITF